eukprot:615907-Hanusia_phi.AAC.1
MHVTRCRAGPSGAGPGVTGSLIVAAVPGNAACRGRPGARFDRHGRPCRTVVRPGLSSGRRTVGAAAAARF